MSRTFTPEQIAQELKLARKYNEYDALVNRRVLAEIVEQQQKEIEALQLGQGMIAEAQRISAEGCQQLGKENDSLRIDYEQAGEQLAELHAEVKELKESSEYWREQYHMLRGTWDGIFDQYAAMTWPPPNHISKAIAGRRRHFALVKALDDWEILPPEKRDPVILEKAIRAFIMGTE